MHLYIANIMSSAAVVLFCLTAFQTEHGNDKRAQVDADGIITHISKAKNAIELVDDFQKLFVKLDDGAVASLVTHPDNSIALRSAWEHIRRLVKREADSKTETSARAQLINEFIWFVKGRLRVLPPSWWCHSLRGAAGKNPMFLSFEEPKNSGLRYDADLRLNYFDHLRVSRRMSGLYVSDGSSAVSLNDLLAVMQIQNPPESSVDVVFTRHNEVYAMCYPDICTSYNLYKFEVGGSGLKCLWKSRVWASDSMLDFSGPGFHMSQIVVDDETIYVFGMGDVMMYIEGFHRADGSSSLRFASLY